jgi:hypothetical protein
MMPTQKPHRSKQDYGTPPELLAAVRGQFGEIGFDLAAHERNHVAPVWYGPGGVAPNALVECWSDIEVPGLRWCNPPFATIARWAERCSVEFAFGVRIALLVPASVGSEWYAEYVEPYARVFALRPRVTFVGCCDPYPKDCILAVYDRAFGPSFGTWRWR